MGRACNCLAAFSYLRIFASHRLLAVHPCTRCSVSLLRLLRYRPPLLDSAYLGVWLTEVSFRSEADSFVNMQEYHGVDIVVFVVIGCVHFHWLAVDRLNLVL